MQRPIITQLAPVGVFAAGSSVPQAQPYVSPVMDLSAAGTPRTGRPFFSQG